MLTPNILTNSRPCSREKVAPLIESKSILIPSISEEEKSVPKNDV